MSKQLLMRSLMLWYIRYLTLQATKYLRHLLYAASQCCAVIYCGYHKNAALLSLVFLFSCFLR